MSLSARRKIILAVSAAIAATLFTASLAQAAEKEARQLAAWTEKELQFVYQGFTTKYSCEGLRARIKDVLLQLGARKDLQISGTGCTSPAGTPEASPGVRVRMNVLLPARPEEPGQVHARWKAVQLKADNNAVSKVGDCELFEQIKREILPLFATRNVELKANCTPRQASPGITRLKVEVLQVDRESEES